VLPILKIERDFDRGEMKRRVVVLRVMKWSKVDLIGGVCVMSSSSKSNIRL